MAKNIKPRVSKLLSVLRKKLSRSYQRGLRKLALRRFIG